MGRELDEKKDRRRLPADYHAVSTAAPIHRHLPLLVHTMNTKYMFIFPAAHTRYCIATTFRAAEMIICGHLR